MVLILAWFADALKYILERPNLPVHCRYSAVSLRGPPCQSPRQGRGGLPCCSAQGVCSPAAGTHRGGYSQCLTARSEMGLGHLLQAIPVGTGGWKGDDAVTLSWVWPVTKGLGWTPFSTFVLMGLKKVLWAHLQCGGAQSTREPEQCQSLVISIPNTAYFRSPGLPSSSMHR